MTKPACKDCRFWCEQDDPDADKSLGECRRYPPTIPWRETSDPACTYDPNEFPLVHRDVWCGEFVLRPDPRVLSDGDVDVSTLAPWFTFYSMLDVRSKSFIEQQAAKKHITKIGWDVWCDLANGVSREGAANWGSREWVRHSLIGTGVRNFGQSSATKIIDAMADCGWPFRD